MEIRKYRVSNLKNLNSCNRIVNEIKKITEIVTATLDKGTRTLYIEFNLPDKAYKAEEFIKKLETKILKAIHVYEKKASIESIDNKEVFRRVLYLRGLDCAYCGSRIEQLAIKEFNHEKIVVDYPTYRFIIETTDADLIEHIEERVSDVAHKVDERIIVQSAEKGKPINIEVASNFTKSRFIFLCIGVIVFICGCILAYESIAAAFKSGEIRDTLGIIFIFIGYLFIGFDVLKRFVINIFKGRILDENFLMTVASIGAIITGKYAEAVLVMLLYQIGESLQNLAIYKSRKSIAALLQYDVQNVKLKVGGEITTVGAEAILVDDVIVVAKGEMIPVDGLVCKGHTILDMKNITGESLARTVETGDEVISGSINIDTTIEIRVTHTYNNSMMTRILELVENATINKAKAENTISKFAHIYTPIVMGAATLILIIGGILLLTVGPYHLPFNWKGVVVAAMEFLVIACPCALVISIPLCYFSSIGVASKRGILIRGSNYIEGLYNVENVVFDKTGTLTKGNFSILEIKPSEGFKESDIKRWFIYTEFFSNHPIGKSLVDQYGRNNVLTEIISDFQSLKGGARALINGSEIYVTNKKLAESLGFKKENVDSPNLVLYVFKDEVYVGAVIVGDVIREEAKNAITALRNVGVKKIAMLTGDSATIANSVGKELGMDEIYAELLPDQKVAIMDEIKANVKSANGTTVYVGDGINDAPVIATADVGIAIGDSASDATISIADVVIMTNDLNKLTELAKLAFHTKRKVLGNITLTLTIKVLVMLTTLVLGLFGITLPMWIAIFADVGVSLLAVLNALTTFILFGKLNVIDPGEKQDE